MKHVKQGKRVFRNPLVKHKNLKVLKKLGLAITITVFAAILFTAISGHTYEAKQKIQLQKTYIQLEQTRQQLLKTKANSADEQKQKDSQIQQLNQQLQTTQQQLEAKRNSATVYADAPTPIPQAVTGCGDNFYKQFIYQHESGCSTAAINSSGGACGLGQAWPCSKLPCSLSDWTCQDKFFDNYAIDRYGSWEAAYYYWVNHSNW